MSILAFGIGQLTGGALVKRTSARITLILAGILFLLGFGFASWAGEPIFIYIFYGLLCGIGSGFIYISVLSTVLLWFEEKKGMVNGVLLMCFGLSSTLMGKLYQLITPMEAGSWRRSFFVFGIGYALVLLAGAWLIRPPAKHSLGEGDPGCEKKSEGSEKPERQGVPGSSRTVSAARQQPEIAPGEVLRDPAFYLMYLWVVLASGAGMIIMSQAGKIMADMNPDFSYSFITTVSGLIFMAGAVGRITCGFIFDIWGRRGVMLLVNVLFALSALLFMGAEVSKATAAVAMAFTAGGYAYGALSTCTTTYMSSRYGMKYYSVNLPLLNSTLFIVAFSSILAGAVYDRFGSYMWVYRGILAAALIDVACGWVLTGGEKDPEPGR